MEIIGFLCEMLFVRTDYGPKDEVCVFTQLVEYPKPNTKWKKHNNEKGRKLNLGTGNSEMLYKTWQNQNRASK